jgi:hypothetical protein
MARKKAKGRGLTVTQELARRRNCRHGLQGVLVSLKDRPGEVFEVHSSYWDRHSKLRLKLTTGESGVSAEDARLESDWPVVDW